MKRKILAMLLGVMLLVGLLPTAALAETVENCTGASCSHAAAIGTTHYDTLAEAVAAVPTGGTEATTVTLLANVTENIEVVAGQNITLLLQNFTLSGGSVETNGEKAAIVNNGTLLIKGTSNTDRGTIKREDNDAGLTASQSCYVIDNQGELTLKWVNVTNNSGVNEGHKGSSLIRVGEINKDATLTITYSTLTQPNFNVIKNSGTVTVSSGAVVGTADTQLNYAILSYGTLNVKFGVINGPVAIRGYKDAQESYSGSATISGGTIAGDITVEQYPGNPCDTKPSLVVSSTSKIDGTIKTGTGDGTTFVEDVEPMTNGTVSLAGGNYKNQPNAVFLAEGYGIVNGTTTGYDYKVAEVVAEFNGKCYATLADAVAAVHDLTGEARMQENVVKLLCNASGYGIGVGYETASTKAAITSSPITTAGNNPVNIKIDLNGNKYTVSSKPVGSANTQTNAFQFLEGSKVTIVNGELATTNTHVANFFKNYADLTLEDVSINIDNIKTCMGILNTTNGVVELKGNTNLTATGTYQWDKNTTGERFAIYVAQWNPNYPDGTQVTINTTGKIAGKVIVNTSEENNKTTLAITGGSFTVKTADELTNLLSYLGEDANATIKLANDVTGGGIRIDTGKTVTIDFDNHTYTVNAPAVGSTGTRNQAFQILKGQTVTMKNGTIAIAASNTAEGTTQKISRVIQNYANLTLQNMNFSDTNLVKREDGEHTNTVGLNTQDTMIECDFGTVLIKGGTYTVSDSGRFAIAVDDWNGSTYEAGTNVTIDGATINGNIRYYSENSGDVPARTGSDLKSTLTIKNQFNGKIYDAAQAVEGGKITVPAGYQLIKGDDNTYTVYRPSSGGGSSTPTPAPAPVTKTEDNTVSVAPQVTATNGEAKVEMSEKNVSDAITAAKTDKAEAIVIAPTVKGNADKVEVALPTTALESVVSGTNAALNVQTDAGAINIPNDTLAEIVKAAGGENISMSVETVATKTVADKLPETVSTEGAVAVNFTITSGENTITSFGGQSLQVQVPVDTKQYDEGKTYTAFIVSDDGSVEQTTATISDGNANVTMYHFSTVVITKEETSPFTDVRTGAYYYDAVLWAAGNGVTAGTDDTHFSPRAECTRAQVVTFLWRAAGCPEVEGATFTDVVSGSYYEKAVAWAVANGITDGTSTTTFSPKQVCSRAQIVTFLYRFNAKDTMNIKVNPFTDVAEGKFYTNAVLWAVENGITDGTSATTFSPASSCLRGQTVTFLYRYFTK